MLIYFRKMHGTKKSALLVISVIVTQPLLGMSME